jgi:hypothetical protein
MADAAYFRAKALHCRELAFTAPDSETQAGLLALADEYLKRALEAEPYLGRRGLPLSRRRNHGGI